MNKQSILEKLRMIKPVLSEKYGLTELALFGSYSRNEESDQSDIDLLVNYRSPMGMRYFDMVYELEDIFKETKVQVISRDGIKPNYFDRIKSDLIYA